MIVVVDACTDGTNGGCAHVCVSTRSGAYVCLCNTGYGLDIDGHNCADIDECTEYGPCEQTCTNTVGSFECSCRTGFSLDSVTNSRCNDVDECANTSLCTGGQICVNSYGSYHCSASAVGISPDIQGEDEDTEETTSLTTVDACSYGTNGGCEHVCAATRNGAYDCLCHDGYKLDSNGHNCTDVDECAEYGPCDQTCTNSPGTYTCGCREGYILDTDNFTCNVVDACSDGTNGGCEHVCAATRNGAYYCLCYDGYKLDSNGHNCTDVDECTELRLCDQTCTNSPGTYTCGCREGYILDTDNFTCNVVDACSDGTNGGCEHVCAATRNGAYYCLCYDGYKLDSNGHNCTDVDECTELRLCDQTCTNSPGTYTCGCREGYILDTDNFTCNAVDACSDSTNGGCEHVCAANRNGAYYCLCYDGFKLDSNGHKCTDVDECTELRLCDQTCTNSPGTYTCGCREGYILDTDNFTCNVVDACSDGTNGGCEHVCAATRNGAYDCLCYDGYKLDSNGHNCTDVDECTELRLCDQTCTNSPGTYTCGCRIGFKLNMDNTTCHDINECDDSPACPEPEVGVSVCINTHGSFYCLVFNEKSSMLKETQLLMEQDNFEPSSYYDSGSNPEIQEDFVDYSLSRNEDNIHGETGESDEMTTKTYQLGTPDVGKFSESNGDLKVVVSVLAGALCIVLIASIVIVIRKHLRLRRQRRRERNNESYA
ncbi:fibrillin-2-like [Ylistrum balloti]|uniref:fibrillin-2-like n=1 Tax=Ylistrum balloti TaxID=509963 RepID=UPI002905C7A9|nr:fibrillin-2-like [Ylistrum balloti]